jgi:hypothetical protein
MGRAGKARFSAHFAAGGMLDHFARCWLRTMEDKP